MRNGTGRAEVHVSQADPAVTKCNVRARKTRNAVLRISFAACFGACASPLQPFLDFIHQSAKRHIQPVRKQLAQPDGRQPQASFDRHDSSSADTRRSRQLLLRKAGILARFLEHGGESFGKFF